MTSAAIGFDHVLGWFADVMKGGRVEESYGGVPGRQKGTLAGALTLLVRHSFFAADDVADAQRLLAHCDPSEIDDEGTRHAAEVLVAIRAGLS
jgi:hypothetical protein